jgi:mRNA interferase MazF
MRKGKIVLVPFPFTDLSGQKVRPAVVLSSVSKGDDFVVCFVSSKESEKIGFFDLKIKADSKNGLKSDSVIKVSKIATLDRKIALGEIGDLDNKTLGLIDSKLKKLFNV